MSQSTLSEETPEADETLVLDGGAAPVYDGPVCEKCGAPSDATACPRCGWYPVLGIHVEIDEAFESAMQTAPVADEAQAAAAPPTPAWQKHVQVWRGLIPAWGWVLIGTTLGAVALGVVARVATLSSPALQTYCGVGGLLGGLFLALLAHAVGFVFCSFEDADFGVSDLVIKPLKIWKQLAGELPEKLWLVNSGNAGLSVALSAALLVGGVPYERLLDWGFKARAKSSLVGAIAQQAAKGGGGGSDDLEGAMTDFAGDANVDDLAGAAAGAAQAPAEKPRQPLDCLILGYQATADGEIRQLLLAADDTGRLRYVGKVAPQLEAEEEADLLAKLEKSATGKPFVKCPESGAYVRPKFTCRVTYTEWERGKRPQDLEWDELLDQLSW